MFKNIILFLCSSLLILGSLNSQQALTKLTSSSGIETGGNDLPELPEAVIYDINGTWNETNKDLTINWSSCTQLYGFLISSQNSTFTYIIPTKKEDPGLFIADYKTQEVVLNLESDLLLPFGSYRIHALIDKQNTVNSSKSFPGGYLPVSFYSHSLSFDYTQD